MSGEPQKPHVLGGTAIKPKERHGWEKVRYFIHNPETGEIFTRTPKSWALITIFYIIYYAFLASFWALLMFVFLQTIDYSTPKWIGENGIIGKSPGLGMRPEQTDAFIDSSMIMFNMASKEDHEDLAGWGGWASRSGDFLKSYNSSGKDCSDDETLEEGEACNFDLSVLGPCGLDGHGYDIGKPCIFLKLNRIFGVDNEYYNETESLPKDMPDSLKKVIEAQEKKNQVWVECHGENPADEEHMSDIDYYPASQGFPSYFFPFQNQKNYQSPIVAIQINKPPIGQLLHVECRAWAKNIEYDKRDRMGLSHFEIFVLNSTDN